MSVHNDNCGCYVCNQKRRKGKDNLRERIAELEAENKLLKEARNRRLMRYIMRICPDCGDDMCGDEHKTCYKCILRGVLTALNTGDIQKDSLLHKHIRQTFTGEQPTFVNNSPIGQKEDE